jgi:tetratricopeptide (TPR) repeat protein
MGNLAVNWTFQGRFKEAEKFQVQVLESSKEVLGKEHPEAIRAMINLADSWYRQKNYAKAKEMQIEVLEMCLRILTETHPETRLARRTLANTYFDLGDRDKGQELWEKETEIDAMNPFWRSTAWVRGVAGFYGWAVPSRDPSS